jgi:hypothetical protein
MKHGQCADVIGGAVIVSYYSAVCGRRRSLHVVLNVHTHRVSGLFRIGFGVNRMRMRFTEQAFQSSSTNGAPSAFPICAWPVVSAPGAACPPLQRIVDGICAACSVGDSEKNGIFRWFRSMRT